MVSTPLIRFSALLCALTFATASSAAVIFDHDFTAAEGFNSANLLFQQGWLGQNHTNVDNTGSGTASTASTTVFPRNLNFNGALGNQAGGAGGPGEIAGPGFNVGDKLRITTEYSFTLDGRFNRDLALFGARHNFVNGGFNAAPLMGAELFYSEFQSSTGGGLKLFGSFARVGSNGADNAFALIEPGLNIGLDPDGVAGPADLVSDLLEISIEMTYLGADQWQTSDLTLTNLTTATLLKDAAVDNPAILTEVQTVPSSNDMFAAAQWMRAAIPDATVDAFKYEFEAAIPEPTSVALIALGSLGLLGRRR